MDTLNTASTSHGGLLFPLDMFRPTVLAAVLAELLVGKVRNILDATIEIARHPSAPLALARIHGSVVGDDPCEFWRTNPDLALAASQVVPRQCFVYYAREGEQRREGFLVAQRGQAIAADDSDRDAAGKHWPVTRLCEQLRISVAELASGFAGGPRVEMSLMEPSGNDQTLLMTLIGQTAAAAAAEEEGYDDEPQPPPPPPSRGGGLTQGFTAPPSSGASAAAPPSPPRPAAATGKPGAISAAEDAKRRATEKAAEQQETLARSESIARALKFVEDARGVVVFVPAELADTDVLRHYTVSAVESSLPEGLPRDLLPKLQGRSIDFAVKVEFLSEVFVGNQPLNRPKFDEKATELDLDGTRVKALEVLAPRLGIGTLLRLDGKNVFVSRKPDAPLPAALLLPALRG